MIELKKFQKDLDELKDLTDQARALQKVFVQKSDEFKKKYRNAIFTKDKEEWCLFSADGWTHCFRFDLLKVHKKQKAQLTKVSKYIGIDKFETFKPTGEVLEDREKQK